MPELLVLCDCGVTIWPFDLPRLPVAVEVFPRALARLLAPEAVGVTGAGLPHRAIAVHAGAFGDLAHVARANQDAFDAAVTALALGRARGPGRPAQRGPARTPTCAKARSCGRSSAEMRIVRLEIEYDGTRFSGWAEQPERRTCEGVLARALGLILRMPVDLHVAGRTDAGVHASGQVATFRSAPTSTCAGWSKSLAGVLPHDIAVRDAAFAPPGFDARASAIGAQLRVPRARRDPARRCGARACCTIRSRST